MELQRVPWFNTEEWRYVYNSLYGENATKETKQTALNYLSMWKARMPDLVTWLESTFTLLETLMNDIAGNLSEHILRLAYSTALMRFVNHILDTEHKKSLNMYKAAKCLNMPDWLVNLRHEVAHSNAIPSLNELRHATEFSLNWLKTYYWDEVSKVISDFKIGDNLNLEDRDEIFGRYLSYFINLILCAHSQLKIKTLSQVPDKTMRESLLTESEELLCNTIDTSKIQHTSLVSLLDHTRKTIMKLARTSNSNKVVVNILLGNESLFLSLDVLNEFYSNGFKNENKLSNNYIIIWEALLTFLHTNDFILDFVEELIKVTLDNEKNVSVRKLAALWLGEIFRAFKKSALYLTKIKKKPELITTKKSEMKQYLHHWYPNTKIGLTLDLTKPIPKQFTDLDYVIEVASAYNPYAVFFVNDLLNLVQPNITKETTDKIEVLTKLISEINDFDRINFPVENVFTIDDLRSSNESGDSSDDCIMMVDSSVYEFEELGEGIWSLASSEYDWANTPIGLLPWQSTKV